MRHIDVACGQLFPIGGASPLLVGCNATSPGVYLAFDPASLSCREYPFVDSLQIDVASPTAALDVDGITRIGAPFLWPKAPSLFPREGGSLLMSPSL